jgi:hypothetical protein
MGGPGGRRSLPLRGTDVKRGRIASPRLRPVAEIVRTASLLVSCTACGKLHKPQCPLALNPVCPPCTGRFTVESLDTGACHRLSEEEIDREVTRTSPGNYALGYLDGGTFVTFYVGRSDADLNECLHAWVGVESRPHRFAAMAKAAYGTRRRRHGHAPGAPALQPVGIVVDGRYTHFVFRYAASAQAAFENECRSYHDFGGSFGLDNERHPVPPEGGSRRCVEGPCP